MYAVLISFYVDTNITTHNNDYFHIYWEQTREYLHYRMKSSSNTAPNNFIFG